MPLQLSRSDLRRHIGEPDFSRGEAYWAQNRVKSGRVMDEGRQAFGQVRGSQGRIYEQTIKLTWREDGRLQTLQGRCSCPVGHNCKHVTALMLNLLPQFHDQHQKRGAESCKDEISGWLDRFEHLDDPAPPSPAAPPKESLYYVLSATSAGALEIELLRIRTLKSGGLSKSPQKFSLETWSSMQAQFLDLADNGILGKLRHIKRLGIATPSGLRVHANDLLGQTLPDLIGEMIATGRAKPFTPQHPSLQWAEPQKAKLHWQERPDGTQKLTVISQNGQELATLPLIPPLYVDLRTGDCGELQLDTSPQLAHALVTMPPVPPKAAREIVKALTKAEAKTPLPREIETIEREGIKPVPVLRLFSQEGQISDYRRRYAFQGFGNEPITIAMLRLSFDYDGQIVSFRDSRDPELRDGDKLITIKRIHELEDAAYERLHQLEEFGIVEFGAYEQEQYGISKRVPRDLMLADDSLSGIDPRGLALGFAQEILPELEADGWRIEIDESWPYRFYLGPIEFKADVEKDKTDWFSFNLKAQADNQDIDLLPIVLSIIEILPLDHLGQLPEDFDLAEMLEDMTFLPDLEDGRRVPVEGEQLVPMIEACLAAHALLNGFHLGEAGEFRKLAEALEGSGIRWQGGEELLVLGRKLEALSEIAEIPPPPSLNGDLRDYQKSGYGWLKALHETGFGGVLADDMGLGKTIQALALLCHRHLEDGTDRPSLLVVPTSLIGNWQREAARFAPGLKLLVLHGPNRAARFGEISGHHLVITTYPLLHRDHKSLFAHKFELAILDEAQAVKNPAAASAKRIREIEARQRLALTGTPIENNLEELWAIYDWVVPGLLGNRKVFRDTFRHPIEQGNDAAAQHQLSTRIRPFLLRRTKEEVATDLPPKTEIDELVRLEGGQRKLYEAVRVAMDARVREAIAARGLASTRITVLDALLKMRQICCDPRLAKIEEAKSVSESAKRQRLLEIIDELLAEGRKILVYSQFVEMLRLIETDVKARGLDCAFLTGQTKKRAEQVDRFQSGAVPLFLISLKAGGVGLNLTAADTVILYDPWWNPAVERQAMDRAHRIGQDKPVFVYKMIAEGSVEAAIQEMQAKKQALTDRLFEGTSGGALGIEEQDLVALFSPLQ